MATFIQLPVSNTLINLERVDEINYTSESPNRGSSVAITVRYRGQGGRMGKVLIEPKVPKEVAIQWLRKVQLLNN